MHIRFGKTRDCPQYSGYAHTLLNWKDKRLPADGAEHLRPEATANPALHRFFAFMAARAVDPDAGLPAQDLQVQHTLSCPFGHTPQAQAALHQLPQQFSVKQQVSNVSKLKRTTVQRHILKAKVLKQQVSNA